MSAAKPPAKSSKDRVEKLRQNRDKQGLRRREAYLTDAEWVEVQALIAILQQKREKA